MSSDNAVEETSSKETLDFHEIFKWQERFMYFTGAHPYIPRNWKWIIQFIFFHGYGFCYMLLIYYSIFLFDVPNGEMSLACYNGTVSGLAIIVSVHYFLFVYHQDSLIYVLKTIEKDFTEADHIPPKEREIVVRTAKKARFASHVWCVFSVLSGEAFLIKSVIANCYYLITEGVFKYILLFDGVTYPAFLENTKEEPLTFLFIFISANWYCTYGCSLYVSFSNVGTIGLVHACGQLEIVKVMVEDIVPEDSVHRDADETKKKLKRIVMKLQDIYVFVDRLNESFKMIYEILMKGVSLVMPLAFFQMVENYKAGAFSMELAVMIWSFVLNTGVPCLFGEQLKQAGENLRNAIYMCRWERYYNKDMRSAILMLLTRMSKTLSINILFMDVCHATLTGVYKMVYTIFNLMNAVYN